VDEGGPEGRSKAQQSGSRANGTSAAMTDAGGDAMRSMALDPASATRQTVQAVRGHPYLTALLLLLFGAVYRGTVVRQPTARVTRRSDAPVWPPFQARAAPP
jgi:hypothetical protein